MAQSTGDEGPDLTLGLTAAMYVVLGMIHLGARSGYEIKRTVDQSIRFFWTISPVQVYPSLRQLEQAGYITGRAEPQGRRPRRVYEITTAGVTALRRWLLQAQPMPFELRDIGMVKLFFADALQPSQAHELLDAVRERSAQLLVTLEAIRQQAEATKAQGNLFPLLTLEMGLAFHQAIMAACDNFETQLPKRAHV
jgi:PadR family transcriptional regulator, regulatory protein AphA